MTLKWNSILYIALLLHRNIYGQNAACSYYANTLDSCDNSSVSENVIDIDFGKIKYQCSCSVSLKFTGHMIYNLANNPGYADCGTSVEVINNYNQMYRLPCARYLKDLILYMNRSSTVELVNVNPIIDGPTNYCLRLILFDRSNTITASCGHSISTRTDANSLQTTNTGPAPSTDGGGCEPTTQLSIQTTMDVKRQYTDYIRFTSAVHTIGSFTGNGLLIGFVICGILVFISTGITISHVIYVLRSRKRKQRTENEDKTKIPKSLLTLTSPWNLQNSAYTTLNPREASVPVNQPHAGLNIIILPEVNQVAYSTRLNSTYTTLNPEQDIGNAGQLYTRLT